MLSLQCQASPGRGSEFSPTLDCFFMFAPLLSDATYTYRSAPAPLCKMAFPPRQHRSCQMKVVHTFAIALLVSGCVSSARPQPPTVDFGPETLSLINSYRASRGLPALASRASLKALARQHSQYQATRGTIGHDGYERRLAQAKAAGFSGICVENVGYDYQSAEQLFSGWRRSARHNRNLLRPDMRYAGVSVVGAYATFFACR